MALLKTSDKDQNKKELEISVDKKVFEQSCDNAYKRRVKRINVPGFRQGKAPRKIIEKMYGEDVFYQDAAEEVYPNALDEAIKESKLDVVAVEAIDTVEIGKEKGLIFKALCVLKPEVEISGYKGLKATKQVIKVNAKEVDAKLDMLKERGARLVTVEDRAAKKGDIIKFNFDGYLDGKQFEGGKAEDYSLTLGSGQFIPGFEDQVEGKEKGKDFEIKVTFPKDYGAKELANKEAVFKCKINEIQVKEYPKIDDEFAKDVSEYDTLQELKDSIKKEIKEEAQKNQDTMIEDQIVSGLIERLKADIPSAMIEKRTNSLFDQFKQRIASQGLKMEDYQKIMGKSEKEFKSQFEEQAERQVKCRLALEKIAQLEKLDVKVEDIDNEYNKLAKDYNTDLKKIKTYIAEDEIKSDLIVEKALKFVKDVAKIEIQTKIEESKPKKAAQKTTTKTTKSESKAEK